MRNWQLFGCFLFIFNSCVAQNKQTLEADIGRIMKKYEAVGVTAVVVKDNNICYTHTFGYNPDYNDTTLRKPISDKGVYVIASISKTFVCTAIMQLVENREIKLDDDVNRYLSFSVRNPKYPEIPITVRMLMCHRSSLNDSQYNWTLDQINPETGKDWKGCYNDYAPGEDYKYCNLGYSLLGAIIENVSGERFDDYIENHITKPLGLYSSYNITRIDSSRLVKALLYDKKRKFFKKDNSIYNYPYYENKLNNYRLGYSVSYLSPTGGVKISAIDLAKYMMMHMNNGIYDGKRIIKKKSEIEMRTPQMGNPEYGLAFSHYRGRIKGVALDGMVGCAHGVHSSMLFNPKEKYGFVVICNGCSSDSSDGQNMNTEIIQQLYKHIVNN